MDHGGKQTALFYIEPNRGIFYGSNITTLLQIAFPQDAITDLDVINREKLSQFIEAFITNSRIVPCPILLLFATNVTFEKDFPDIVSKDAEGAVHGFLDMVPFEDVLSKSYKLDKKDRLVALNQELLDVIKHAFEKQKFSVVGAVPVTIISASMEEFSKNVDLTALLAKFDAIKQFNLIPDGVIATQDKLQTGNEKKSNKRAFVLLGVFAVLLVILVVLIFTMVLPSGTQKLPPSQPLPPLQRQTTVQTQPTGTVVKPLQQNTTSSSSGSSVTH